MNADIHNNWKIHHGMHDHISKMWYLNVFKYLTWFPWNSLSMLLLPLSRYENHNLLNLNKYFNFGR